MTLTRRRIHRILEIAEPGDRPSRVFDIGIRGLIAANVVAVVVESVPEIQEAAAPWFRAFDLASVAVFSVEYVLRVWSAPEDDRYRRSVRGRLRFMATPLALIDLAAVLPAYLPMVGVDLRILRGVRLVRLVRVLKLARYSRALRSLGRTFRRKREELALTLSMVGLLVLIASTLMYYAEHTVQPETFGSIPDSMWWGVVTLTTLGYGDVVPVTLLGRFMGGLFALSGLLVIALPTAILGSGFVEELASSPTGIPEGERRGAPGVGEPGAGEPEDATPPVRCPRCGARFGLGGEGSP